MHSSKKNGRDRIKNLISNLIVVILAITAFMLGYFIIPKEDTKEQKPYEDIKKSIITDNKEITEEEVFGSIPGKEAPEEEKIKFGASIMRIATETTNIEIGNCSLSPRAIKTELGAKITFNNGSKEKAEITIEGATHAVEAGKKLILESGFGRGTGVFGYSCADEDNSMTGWIAVK